jgi:o-succinylbenzoate synthase
MVGNPTDDASREAPLIPSWDDLVADAHVVAVPMRVPFRGVRVREAVLLRGPVGWGEFAPFLEYDDDEAARWLAAAVEAAWTGWPAPLRDRVPVNATVPAVAARDVEAVLARFPGCTTAKVKVAQEGQVLADDVDRVAAVRAALGGTGRVRVDANGAWDLAAAVDALTALAAFDLEYAEQLCASVDELVALRVALARAGLDVPVAADESVRKAEDPRRVALAGAADVVVLKTAPLRGVAPALEVAQACGLPVVVSSALDTSVGIRAGLALAAALPDLPYACGLATVGLLTDDVTAEPLVPVDGALPVRDTPADPDRLARLAAPPEREAAWRERARRCWERLGCSTG